MVELQPSKLATGVRFPSPAPFFLWGNILNHAIKTVGAKYGIEPVRFRPLAVPEKIDASVGA